MYGLRLSILEIPQPLPSGIRRVCTISSKVPMSRTLYCMYSVLYIGTRHSTILKAYEYNEIIVIDSDVRTRVKVLEYLYSEYFFEYSVLVLEYIAK